MTLQDRFAQIGISQTVFAALACRRGPLKIWQRHVSDWCRDEIMSANLSGQLERTLQELETWLSGLRTIGTPKPSLESVENIEVGLKIWHGEQSLSTMFARSAPLHAFSSGEGYEPNPEVTNILSAEGAL